jgi:molybdenum cofactor cytidylyltransferase
VAINPAVRAAVDLRGADVVVNEAYGEGCSSSIAAALGALRPGAEVLVLLLGDQPGVSAETVRALVRGRGDARSLCAATRTVAATRSRSAARVFGDLAALHGDKGVWKLLDGAPTTVVEVPIAGRVPLDVDTWEDYEAVLAS